MVEGAFHITSPQEKSPVYQNTPALIELLLELFPVVY